jgi:hypothetical protein
VLNWCPGVAHLIRSGALRVPFLPQGFIIAACPLR